VTASFVTTSTLEQRRRSLWMVFGCTLFGAAGQILIKSGASSLGAHPSVFDIVLRILTTLPLFAGYSLYGVSMVLLVMALRHGELSLLYPVIALTYVWVTVLSFLIFHDGINPWKLLGIVLIVSGVAVLGKGGKP
jgi:drug/metabolite transporter (DMT)-like permease